MLSKETRSADRRDIFDLFDRDSDGKITNAEIVKTFRELNLPISQNQAILLVDEFDLNGDGELEFTEFILLVKKYMKMEDYPVEGMFNYFDRDRDGYITMKEFIDSLKHLGIRVAEENAITMMKEFSVTGPEKMSYIDFLRMMRHYF